MVNSVGKHLFEILGRYAILISVLNIFVFHDLLTASSNVIHLIDDKKKMSQLCRPCYDSISTILKFL